MIEGAFVKSIICGYGTPQRQGKLFALRFMNCFRDTLVEFWSALRMIISHPTRYNNKLIAPYLAITELCINLDHLRFEN